MKRFENKLTHNKITFTLSNLETFEEREMHSYHELLFVLEGDLLLFTRDFQQKVKSGTLIIIPKESFHFFKMKENSLFARLKIAFNDTDVIHSFKGIKIIKDIDGNIEFLLKEITDIVNASPDECQKMKLYGAFLMLIAEINFKDSNAPKARNENHLIPKCLRYIDESLDKKLTVENVSKALFISPSTLSHEFKKEMGISFHRYVSEKRLMHINKKISLGVPPTEVYKGYGYADYSSFYRAYKKHFGYPPSH